MSFITPSISTPIDVNTSIYFTAPSGYYSYTWSGAATGSGTQSNTVSFTTPGTYTVSVLICDENNCCGSYSYTFDVVNECAGVTISTSSNSCTNITVTVTGGTGTKTYKVDGPYGTTTPVTALPGGGVFTIDTSSFLAGATGTLTITVYIDDGSEICSKTATVNYTRCNCLCNSSNNCVSAAILTSGGDSGYTKDLGIFQAGTAFDWYFDPQAVVDRFEVEYNGVTILDTGNLTRYSLCHCNGGLFCSCADYFLGDIAQSTTIQIPVITGFMNLNVVSPDVCSEDSSKPKWISTSNAPAPLNLVVYSVYGTIFLDPLIALQGLVRIKITGNVCGGGTTAWTFGMKCV